MWTKKKLENMLYIKLTGLVSFLKSVYSALSHCILHNITDNKPISRDGH